MAKFNAGKIISLLEKPGPGLAESSRSSDARLVQFARSALSEVCDQSPSHRSLAVGLLAILDRLEWYKGKSGPFGSANFEQSHMHALLVGPGALEHRIDLRIGLTLLAPYTRFPDHHQYHSRVFLPLSFGEFRFGDEDWIYSGAGEVLFNGAGRQCAIRCTGKPLLMLWCHIERYGDGDTPYLKN
ncbi:dimethylsulfonioproprionate lyase family protein [Rhizobium sp. BK068]|uniref:dimethylsulfonioproprionate lyase family protein n=1 Tax=Rhizobium sp. BK068 TaxID=2512130 RepID=UPI001045BF5E|nr:dimethylsulfonioproprionate lyase family protein [Rhizobium sp. BK068]